MISKNLIKLIRSLDQKKYRRQEGLFVAEGPKVVGELMATMQPELIVATEEYLREYGGTGARGCKNCKCEVVTADELRRISFLQHPQQVLALFPLPTNLVPSNARTPAHPNLILALDGVQDPGNVGTIIRLADWFGIDTIICSRDTADAFAPKVVQATMGSIARVHIIYTDIVEWLDSLAEGTPVYGTLLDGDNIYSQSLQRDRGVIVMGNEGNGISTAVRSRITHRLRIPSFPEGRPTAESLNVAIATAIICSEFRRPSL